MAYHDPMMAACEGLVDDLKFKKAVDAGEMLEIHPGLHLVNDAGELEYIGSREEVEAEMAAEYEAAYVAAYERSYQAALESIVELNAGYE